MLSALLSPTRRGKHQSLGRCKGPLSGIRLCHSGLQAHVSPGHAFKTYLRWRRKPEILNKGSSRTEGPQLCLSPVAPPTGAAGGPGNLYLEQGKGRPAKCWGGFKTPEVGAGWGDQGSKQQRPCSSLEFTTEVVVQPAPSAFLSHRGEVWKGEL